MRKVLLVAVLVVVAGAIDEDPAAAHGVEGVEPTNYETRVLVVDPEIEGVEVRPVDLGESMELRNTTATEVIVLGYFGEPYLRVGPDGVFENRVAPSWVANQEADRIAGTPDLGARDREPEWVRTGGGDTVRWHDHRAHWMADQAPEWVRTGGSHEQVVQEFEITFEHGEETVRALGEVVWVPGPSPWPWAIAAAVLGLGLVALSRTRWWSRVLLVALVLLVATETVHVLGVWGATTAGFGTELAASIYSIAALGVAVAATAWLVAARDPYDATPLVLVAGLFVAIAGGFADLTTLARSQLPTGLAPGLARTAVVVALGLGSGLTVAAALRIRRPAASAPRES